MNLDMKKDLLIATLMDPGNLPAKVLDGGRYIGPRSHLADLPDEQVATFDMVAALLVKKYDENHELIQ